MIVKVFAPLKDSRIIILLFVVLFLNLMDTWLTYILINLGAQEMNPIYQITHSLSITMLFKYLFVLLYPLFLGVVFRYKKDIGFAVLFFILVFSAFPVLWNLGQLYLYSVV